MEAAPPGSRRGPAAAAAPHGRGAAVEHRPAGGRVHAAVRRARGGGGVVRGAHHAAGAGPVGGAAGAPARDPRLRDRLRVGLDRTRPARLPGRGDDHDAVAVPARVPARGERPAAPRRDPRGGGQEPRHGAVADLHQGHPAPDPPGAARGLPAGGAGAAGGVRSV